MKTKIINFIYGRLRLVTFIIAITLPNFAFSQTGQNGSVEYLKYSNGINGITLGTDIRTLTHNNLTYLDGDSRPDGDSCYKYAITDTNTLKMPDSLNLDMIGIRTYKNKIVNIYLFFKQKDAYKILSDFLNSYGVFTQKPVEYADIYNWNTQLVSLSLMYEVKIDEGVAVFTSNPVQQEVAANKIIRQSRYLASKTEDHDNQAPVLQPASMSLASLKRK